MIELYYWPTPNAHKITMFLEEAGLDYRLISVNIGVGEQFKPAFLAISPNNRIPAIIDTTPNSTDGPVSLFESGAILLYLAEKTRGFIPEDLPGRCAVLQWLFWQVAGLGPMAGQNHHFVQYASERISYAIDRYVRETNRLYGVLDRRLADRTFLAGESYTIADIATYPWIVPWARQLQSLSDFPHLHRWFTRVAERPATARAYARAQPYRKQGPVTDAERAVLFGQTAESARRG